MGSMDRHRARIAEYLNTPVEGEEDIGYGSIAPKGLSGGTLTMPTLDLSPSSSNAPISTGDKDSSNKDSGSISAPAPAAPAYSPFASNPGFVPSLSQTGSTPSFMPSLNLNDQPSTPRYAQALNLGTPTSQPSSGYASQLSAPMASSYTPPAVVQARESAVSAAEAAVTKPQVQAAANKVAASAPANMQPQIQAAMQQIQQAQNPVEVELAKLRMQQLAQQAQAGGSSNTMTYVLLGGAALLGIALIAMMSRGRSSSAPASRAFPTMAGATR